MHGLGKENLAFRRCVLQRCRPFAAGHLALAPVMLLPPDRCSDKAGHGDNSNEESPPGRVLPPCLNGNGRGRRSNDLHRRRGCFDHRRGRSSGQRRRNLRPCHLDTVLERHPHTLRAVHVQQPNRCPEQPPETAYRGCGACAWNVEEQGQYADEGIRHNQQDRCDDAKVPRLCDQGPTHDA